MNTKELRISDDLRLPADDFIESKGAIIGKSGRGKSGGVKVVLEECVRNKMQFVEFDPSGVGWGIRSSFDGSKPSGAQILVVGGRHGDVKLERSAGAEVAREIVRSKISCVIDFQGEPKSVYRQFTKDFCETLLEINDSPIVVILEEAHELVPQLIRPDQTQTFDAVSRLVGQGRNMGIGVVLVSQRTMKINKDVLSQADWVLVFGLSGKHDRKAIQEWLEDKDVEDDLWEKFENGLAKLARQHAWFWSPEAFGGAFKAVKIRNFTTFHPDRTHLRKLGLLDIKPVSTDIAAVKAKLGEAMAKLAEEKTAVVSAKQLQAQIRKLEGELAKEKARPAAASAPKVNVKRVEVPVIKPDQVRRVEQLVTKISKEVDGAVKTAESLKGLSHNLSVEGGRLAAALAAANRPAPPARAPVYEPPRSGFVHAQPAPRPRRQEPTTDTNNGGSPAVKAGARRMLQALGTFRARGLSRDEVGTLAGISSNSGTFSDYLSALRSNGYMEEFHGTLKITDAGLNYLAGDIPHMPASTSELVAMWRPKLKAGAARMLDHLVRIYPEPISRAALGDLAEISSNSGTFSDYLSMLRRNRLLEDQGSEVRAHPALFIDQA